jgi:hypothetical protein
MTQCCFDVLTLSLGIMEVLGKHLKGILNPPINNYKVAKHWRKRGYKGSPQIYLAQVGTNAKIFR